MTPLEVETTATPRPPWTLGSSSREAGISTLSNLALPPLRMRVNISPMLSVMLMIVLSRLPAGLHDPGDLALQGHIPKADAADSEFAQNGPGTPAQGAAVVIAHRKLGVALVLGDLRFLGHLYSPQLFPEGQPHQGQQLPALFVRGGRGHDGDIHAFTFVDLVVVDFRKDDLLLD